MELTILVLIIMAAALILMPAHIYAPDEKPDRPSIPPDLIQGGTPPDDAFRSPQVMDQRLEDLGRFNMRYHQADAFAWIPGWSVIRRWFR